MPRRKKSEMGTEGVTTSTTSTESTEKSVKDKSTKSKKEKGENQLPEVGTVMVKESEERKKFTPSDYFNLVKENFETETEEDIKALYSVVMKKLNTTIVTGQLALSKALFARAEYLAKEYKIIRAGITKYIDRTLIDKYIDEVADECVVVLELKNYEREIPDEVIEIVTKTKDIFDNFFIVFTDYTGEERKKVAKERRDKDPILFGNIYIDGKVSPKMYFIGDWVDGYCDLTLDKMIKEVVEKEGNPNGKTDYVFDIESTSDIKKIEDKLKEMKNY